MTNQKICHHTNLDDWDTILSTSISTWESLMIKDQNVRSEEYDRWNKEEEARFGRGEEDKLLEDDQLPGLKDAQTKNSGGYHQGRYRRVLRVNTKDLPRILEERGELVSSPMNEVGGLLYASPEIAEAGEKEHTRNQQNSPIYTISPKSSVLTETSSTWNRCKRSLTKISSHFLFSSKSHSDGSITLVDADEMRERSCPQEGFISYENYLRKDEHHITSNQGSPMNSWSSSMTLVDSTPTIEPDVESEHEVKVKLPRIRFLLPFLPKKPKIRSIPFLYSPELSSAVTSTEYPKLFVRLSKLVIQLDVIKREKRKKEIEDRRKKIELDEKIFGGKRETETGFHLHPQMYWHWRQVRAEGIPWWVIDEDSNQFCPGGPEDDTLERMYDVVGWDCLRDDCEGESSRVGLQRIEEEDEDDDEGIQEDDEERGEEEEE